ncbi:MAG: 3-ketoacyl-ACP reductase [Clostridia bacterium]|nr:3-ketoacyl-ACP reductase [Clostridia bacterium]MBR6620472.1 3-ketoacyl-ACP reductase [Clostridia bacterium]
MTAVITGGTRGIGLGIAKELLKNGFTVVATSRNTNEEFEKLSNEYPDRLLFIPCDISSVSDIENLVLQVKNKFGKIDLLVNNAGVAPKERKDILELNPEEFDYVTDINMKGTFFVTQKFVDLLKAAGSARIVNISSMSAYTASVNRGEYCISKAGISMITKLYAARLAEYGISVIEIRPGIIETDMTAKVKEKYEKLISDGITPIKRMGKPSDIGRCVAAIAKGDFDFCTGTVIDCDGGFNVRCL